jgi:hypothetical protein
MLSKDMHDGALSTLAAGWGLFLTVDGSGVRVRDGGINTARVTQADMIATNGIVHIVNEVLVPVELVGTVLGTPVPLAVHSHASE